MTIQERRLENSPSGGFVSNLFSWKRQLPIFLFSLIILFIALILYNPNMIDPVDYELPGLVELKAALAVNNRLNASFRIFERKIIGGESLVYHAGSIYTGSHDGSIYEIKNGQASLFTKIGIPDCKNVSTCGRPLGMRLDERNQRLLVVDAYNGLLGIPLKNPSAKERIFPTSEYQVYQGVFFNDVDIVADGVYVLTHSSKKHKLLHLTNMVLESLSDGEVLLVDTKHKKFEIIASNIAFPNGIQVLPDKKWALVAECLRNRILRVKLDGSKVELLTDRIPGMPDNIRPSPRGGYWVALASASHKGDPGLIHWLRHHTTLRWILHKLVSPAILHAVSRTPLTIVVRITETGEVIESLNGVFVDGLNAAEVLELKNGTIFLGTYYLPFLRQLEPETTS